MPGTLRYTNKTAAGTVYLHYAPTIAFTAGVLYVIDLISGGTNSQAVSSGSNMVPGLKPAHKYCFYVIESGETEICKPVILTFSHDADPGYDKMKILWRMDGQGAWTGKTCGTDTMRRSFRVNERGHSAQWRLICYAPNNPICLRRVGTTVRLNGRERIVEKEFI